MIKTACFQCRGTGLISSWEKYDSICCQVHSKIKQLILNNKTVTSEPIFPNIYYILIGGKKQQWCIECIKYKDWQIQASNLGSLLGSSRPHRHPRCSETPRWICWCGSESGEFLLLGLCSWMRGSYHRSLSFTWKKKREKLPPKSSFNKSWWPAMTRPCAGPHGEVLITPCQEFKYSRSDRRNWAKLLAGWDRAHLGVVVLQKEESSKANGGKWWV